MGHIGNRARGQNARTGVTLSTFHKFVTSSSFTARRIFFYMAAEGGSKACTFAIYGDNAGNVGTRLASTSEVTVTTTAGWYSASLASDVAITMGTYWIAQTHASGTVTCYTEIDPASVSHYATNAYSAANAPSSLTGETNWETTRFSCYADGGIADPAGPLPVLLFQGDSWTYGHNATSGQGTVSGTTYEKHVMAALVAAGYEADGVNHGTSGHMYSDLVAENASVDAYINPSVVNTMVLFCGINDIGLAGRSAAQIYTDAESYCAARRIAGWNKIVLVTLPPNFQGGSSATFNAVRNTLNGLYIADHSFADGLARLDLNSNIGDDGDELNTTYYSADKVHLNDLGYSELGSVIANALPALLLASTYSEIGSGGSLGGGTGNLSLLIQCDSAGGAHVNGSVVGLVIFSDAFSGGATLADQAVVNCLIVEVASGGVMFAGSAETDSVPEPDPEPSRRSIYPLITFRVNLDFSGTSGVPSTPYSQSFLGLNTIGIPGVGRVKHGDEFTLDGIDADYVRRNYAKIGRLYDDPRDTLEVLSIE